jgi:hypothetical protein
LSALLYDAQALREIEELIGAVSSGATDDLSATACRAGLADPRLRDLAVACFDTCEAAMRRFPTGWFGDDALRALSAFRERYVEPGMTQSDESRSAGLVTPLR